MTIKTAIEKAIEGGWNSKWFDIEVANHFVIFSMPVYGIPDQSVRASWMIERVLLDPSFWKSLCVMGVPETDEQSDERSANGTEQWKYLMHRMIDHLAEGGTIESYFESL